MKRARGGTARAVATLLLAAVPSCAAAHGQVGGSPPPIDRLFVDKSDHRLEAWSGSRLVHRYRVALGRGGLGPKRYEGDGRTPEGRYRIDSRHVSARFHRFLHVSYPEDADRAAFRRGQADGTIPAGARLGGDVGIHGVGPRFGWLPHTLVDWTAGCIAVDDDEIEVLYRNVVPGAVVEIVP